MQVLGCTSMATIDRRPNKRPALDSAVALSFHIGDHWRGASEAGRYALALLSLFNRIPTAAAVIDTLCDR